MCVQMDYNAELMKYLFVSVAINHRVKQGRCEWEALWATIRNIESNEKLVIVARRIKLYHELECYS